MIVDQTLKKNISTQIEKLPEYRLQQVLDFINVLVFNEDIKPTISLSDNMIYDKVDYVTQYIGGISHGSLAQNIDRELYGK